MNRLPSLIPSARAIRHAPRVLALLLACCLATVSHAQSPSACDTTAGLQIDARADARDDGYLLSPALAADYFRTAAYDLVQGRVSHFELEQAPGHLLRYHLADARSPACIERRLFDAQLAGLPMPADSCIAATPVSAAASRYLIEGDKQAIALRERQSGRLLAQYRRPGGILQRLADLLDRSDCAPAAAVHALSFWQLTAFVFPDRWGETIEPSAIAQPADGAEPDDAADLLPPFGEVRRKLAEEDRLDRRRCWLPGWMGATEVHQLELGRGPLEIEARLDAKSRTAGVVLVDVHAPDKAVVLLARAHGPTVWHIHESSRTSLVAILLRGHHGQAVEGVTPYTRILMSTALHNPHTHCTSDELREIEEDVIRRYGIASRQRQPPGEDPPVPRYSIGEPMPDGAELFHMGLTVADFELRDE